MKETAIVTAVSAYDKPTINITYLLLFNQALHILKMKHHLLNPNQMRAAGAMVNETPFLHLPMESR